MCTATVEPVDFLAKVDYDGDIRRFRGAAPVRATQFLEWVADAWPEALAAGACLKYEDEDGDLCTLTPATFKDLQLQNPDGAPLRTAKLKLVRPPSPPTQTEAPLAECNKAAPKEQAEAGKAGRACILGLSFVMVAMAFLATFTVPAQYPTGHLLAPLHVQQPLTYVLAGQTRYAAPLHWYFRSCWKESATVSGCIWQAYLSPWTKGRQIRLQLSTSIDMPLIWSAEVASKTDDGHFTIRLNVDYAPDFGGVLFIRSSDPIAAIQELRTALNVEGRIVS